MSLSAVRVGVLLLAAFPLLAQSQEVFRVRENHQDFRQVPTRTSAAYRQLLPSLATLQDHGIPSGCAVLIDPTGLFIAHQASIAGPEVEGRFWNGSIGHFHVLGQDPTTQLVLLRSDVIPPDARPITAPPGPAEPGTALVVVMTDGSVRARIESNSLLGVVRPSRRIMPLSEIRFETPIGTLGGALVFTETGYFLGVLNATLSRFPPPPTALPPIRVGQNRIQELLSRGGGSIGPADLTVAYTPGVDVIRRVLEGFTSPTHDVQHPSIGIYCRDGAGGALVTAVVPDSPADQAGVKIGDLIIGIDLYRIRNQLDFAKLMLRERLNSKIVLRIDRGGREFMRSAIVGRSIE
jgi:S1-C subfamily serine protease